MIMCVIYLVRIYGPNYYDLFPTQRKVQLTFYSSPLVNRATIRICCILFHFIVIVVYVDLMKGCVSQRTKTMICLLA